MNVKYMELIAKISLTFICTNEKFYHLPHNYVIYSPENTQQIECIEHSYVCAVAQNNRRKINGKQQHGLLLCCFK